MTTSARRPVVHLLAGYNGAGKTTYAKELEISTGGVRFSLDEWMLRLHPDLRFDSEGYGVSAEACKQLIWNVAKKFLEHGVDVILDWNQWSRDRRKTWLIASIDAGFQARLHYLQVPLETALRQSERRSAMNTAGSHRLPAEDVRHLAAIFEHPTTAEGMPLIVVTRLATAPATLGRER